MIHLTIFHFLYEIITKIILRTTVNLPDRPFCSTLIETCELQFKQVLISKFVKFQLT